MVGADGTNSAVRQQLIPEAVVDELHWAVYGRTPIGAETLDWMPDVLLDSFNRVIGPGEAAMAVATCRTREPVRQASARLAPGALLTDIPDYFSWTMPLLDLRFRDADPATLHQLASETVAGWHPAVGRLVGEADVSATFPVCITSSRPVPRWQASNITLLGDAIHTMSPGRGDGANIALKDARLLCGTLVEVASQRVTLAAAKAHYETEMLHYAFRAVADSLNKPFAPAVPSRR
ncbi:MAG TPA: FAD-dependent monooxygenase [Pseudonocardiaceae bacterium]